MIEEHNRHAGQGAVVLDIGGDVGALVVAAPPSLAGAEIEIRPVPHPAGAPPRHVAVVRRSTPSGVVFSAVFADMLAGVYELSRRPDGPVALRVVVAGGEVTSAAWPADL